MDQSPQERRRHKRYPASVRMSYLHQHDFKARIFYRIIDSIAGKSPGQKHAGRTKNVSAAGLCFSSDQKLQRGDILDLEVYPPGAQEPVLMKAEARWSSLVVVPVQPPEIQEYDTGVHIMSVNGQSVLPTIRYDEKRQQTWSIVLENILVA